MDALTFFLIIVLVFWILSPIALLILLRRTFKELKAASEKILEKEDELKQFHQKYEPITSIENEIEKLKKQEHEIRAEIVEVRSEYNEKRKILINLKQQVAIYDERLSFVELGIYEPQFDFGDSEKYKDKIKEIRQKQKDMVSKKIATICPADWTVDGSRSKGQSMINRQARLTMRAFNNECEAAIANTRWNNVVAMEKRILNASKQINKSNSSMNLVINEDYVALKLDEIHVTYEYREQLKKEREERTELARAEREEKRLLEEAATAEKEEIKYTALLNKARKEVGVDERRIAELEAALAESKATSERARAMAEMTKSGYVYIISNIGSFGERVVKIGLTRRLDPDDRVRELGDASVPFTFDTHAIIYSEEAPALETALHKEFNDKRVNKANMRKEFFNVELEEVEKAVKRLAPDANFFKDREAQEWHETMAMRNKMLKNALSVDDEFPEEI